MEIWIRTQDREDLIKCDNLGLAYKGKYNFVDNDVIKGDECYICQFTENSHCKLGKYATKERAIKVLNDICQRIVDLQTLEIAPKRNINCIYDIPKE